MSFLDNLENNLKALESVEERDSGADSRREAERNRSIAEAPWAEKLKQSPFTEELLVKASRARHKLRSKVYVAWLGTTLRLEMKGRKLDLRPTPQGIMAVMSAGGREASPRPVDLSANAGDLLDSWIDFSPE